MLVYTPLTEIYISEVGENISTAGKIYYMTVGILFPILEEIKLA